MAEDSERRSGTDKAAKEKMAKGMSEAGKAEIGKAGDKDVSHGGQPGTHDMIEGMSEAGRHPTTPEDEKRTGSR
ncbi:hypothetical protein [Benzoatithermus flavus]|uniref:Uncharacterized protein n=1 Tax=Benzoatithermus flavus TaxID=3108223 RepID=A0ABU8XY11_9PROT